MDQEELEAAQKFELDNPELVGDYLEVSSLLITGTYAR